MSWFSDPSYFEERWRDVLDSGEEGIEAEDKEPEDSGVWRALAAYEERIYGGAGYAY